jgi:hypothetical protein
MFADYQRLVVEYYQWKKGHNKLRSELSYPTQAKLKKESVRLCKGKIQHKDEKGIKDFCEDWDDKKTCLQNIGNYDVDKFKPLSNYLRRSSDDTDPKNIELLAWLIDFKSRPYDLGKDYTAPLIDFLRIWDEVEDIIDPASEPFKADSPLIVEGKDDGDKDLEDEAGESSRRENAMPEKTQKDGLSVVGKVLKTVSGTGTGGDKRKSRMRTRWFMVAGVLLIGMLTSSYWWWDTKPGGCMYWVEDHYQSIPCDQKVPNKFMVAFDSAKVKNFRKIPSDNITLRSLGLVWYSKINNEVEFFTASGDHPIVIDRHLKPITALIVKKYGRQDTVSSPR